MRVYDAIGGAVRGGGNAGGVKADEILCLLNGKDVDRRAEALLQADALYMLRPAVGRHEKEVANGAVADIFAIQFLKMLVFLNAFPGDADIHLFGVLDTHPRRAAPG